MDYGVSSNVLAAEYCNDDISLVASNIVALHGGRIGILSEGEGKGSSFIVDIPISQRSNQVVSSHSPSLVQEEPSAEVR